LKSKSSERRIAMGKVRAWYDKSEDIFYMLFKEGPSHEVVEADPDVHLELDEKGRVISIEIWNAQKCKQQLTKTGTNQRFLPKNRETNQLSKQQVA